MSELVKPGVTAAFASWGRWVARCSYQDRCDAAIQVVRFAGGLLCPECGMATAVVWPSADMVAGIERLLLMRPHWKNQNWLPGETLHDLLEQNAEHGILSRHAAELPAGAVFGIEGDRITRDALPTLNPKRELVR